MRHTKWIKGVSVVLSFFGTLLIVANTVATSSSDYKNLVDGIFGIHYSSSTSNNIETYNYHSKFKNTTELLTDRARIAKQLEEEGVVLLKNDNSTLPLRKSENQPLKVTILGSRAFTFKNNANRTGLRDILPNSDKELNSYAGIVGSRTWRMEPTLYEEGSNQVSKKVKLPITLIDGLGHQNIEVNPSCEQVYANKPFPNPVSGSEMDGSFAAPFSVNEPAVSKSEFSRLDEYKDAVIVVLGRMSGEGREYIPGERGIADKTDGSRSALNLSNSERELINLANEIAPGKVVVLLNSAIPMEIEELKNSDKVSSILWIGLPGLYGMDGVAKVISGSANPSGSLPDVFAVDASMSPAAQNYEVQAADGKYFRWKNGEEKGANNTNTWYYTVMAEGIYDGYYYYETRYNDVVFGDGNANDKVGAGREAEGDVWSYDHEVTYTFGFGLSYTSFETELVENENGQFYKFDAEKLSLSTQVKVKNTGTVAGKKSVQLYLSSPFTDYDKANGVEKSAIQLMGFEKTKLLEPLEEEILTIEVPIKYLGSYQETLTHDGINNAGGYILEDGNYYFSIGNGAHQALNNVIVKKDATKRPGLYVESYDEEPNANLTFAFNPANETALTSLDRGEFVDGVNSRLLNKTKDDVIIKNQISSANYNYYSPNTITYLSRTNWKDTFPVPYTELSITSEMEYYLGVGRSDRGHVYKFKTGHVEEEWGVNHEVDEDEEESTSEPLKNMNIAGMKNASFDDERWDYLLEQITFNEAKNFVPNGGNSCKALTSVNSPEVWQIDGPNGNVNKGLGERASRTGPTPIQTNDPNYNYKTCDMPCEPIVAATFNKQLVEEEGENFGEVSLWDGSKICWAPGMNLHRLPFNSRGHEYYSEDPMLTNNMGVAFVRGGLSKGAILSAKHFAFNVQETCREGLSQFLNEQSGRELELRGFQGLAEDVNYQVSEDGKLVNAIGLMSSFSRLGVTGVNAHTGLMVNILREEWGYKGLISTDFVGQGNYFNPQDCAINYVTFMACGSAPGLLKSDWAEYNNKAASDPDMNKALKKVMKYYLYAVANSNALNGFDVDSQAIDSAAKVSPWQVGLITGGTISLVLATGGIAAYVVLTLSHKRKQKRLAKEGE